MGDDRIVRPDNTWRTVRAASGGLLVDARDYYLAFYRAALEARSHILLAGWQFDRGVKLVRGEDRRFARTLGGETRLLPLLDRLCKTRPELRVYILAWDFHVVFALEREWMQKAFFHWATHERLSFRFDDCHAPGGCHHQKFAVIDGQVSFVGGIDLCEARWDDRRHLAANTARVTRGRPQKPYHDVQAYFGDRPMASALRDLFRERWRRAGGDDLVLPEGAATGRGSFRPRGAIPFPPGKVALHRTDPGGSGSGAGAGSGSGAGAGKRDGAVFEIRDLLERALALSRRLIYIETQYFSSRHLCACLIERMRAARRAQGRLEIVVVVNARAEAVKEEVAVGLRQSENFRALREAARKTGHALGIYLTVAAGRQAAARAGKPETATYIHSKLTIVDDRFLSMGSANLTNRSLGVDSELNVSWEAPPSGRGRLVEAIRKVRVSLLAEHLGLMAPASQRRLARGVGLVAHLDDLVARRAGRLREVPPLTPAEETALGVIDPQALPFDPEAPDRDGERDGGGGGRDGAAEAAAERPLFRMGIGDLWDRLTR